MRKRGGEVYYHEQDGYADEPTERTEEENEHVAQVRRFAKYWVYRKRGYDTLEPRWNPDRILAAVVAVAPLTADAVERYFGDLHQQLRSVHEDVESVVALPEDTDSKEAVYMKDIYLGLGEGGLDAAAAEILAQPKLMTLIGATVNVGGERPDGAEFLPEFRDIVAEASGRDPDSLPSLRDGLLIDAVSGVYVQYGPSGEATIIEGDQPALERDPDARLELYAYDEPSISDFHVRLVNNLVCQARDCYLLAGIAPPKQLRIGGPGFRRANGWYNSIDLYERYWNPDAEITTWFEEHTPDDAYTSETA
ncbi:hypothetical protein [Natronobiforma cellulositropha]|uniref:hypothetical protein n=1 Tax=Natronobiforma cellulositropha TaxID=1679076 RepID=UPI0021D5BD5D|nr:hypothetical protein [Natronobiforma cellulositropha]